MSALSVVLLVVGILGAQVAIWIPVLLWLRRKSAAMIVKLRAELGEPAVWGPKPANYCGATAGFSKVSGNGVLAVTATRLVFRKLIGGPIELPLARIKRVREDKWFRRGYRGGNLHLILGLDDDSELAFIAKDFAAFKAAVTPHQ